jgi:hypothetical protein
VPPSFPLASANVIHIVFFAPFERYEITQKIFILFYFSSTLFRMAKNKLQLLHGFIVEFGRF